MKKKEGSRKNDKKEGKKSKGKDRPEGSGATTLDRDRPGEGGETTFDNDPPIIVQGGSFTVSSKFFLTVRFDERTGRYIYETDQIKIGRIRTKGKDGEQNNAGNQGVFTIDLFSE